jgi:hypothetical protein
MFILVNYIVEHGRRSRRGAEDGRAHAEAA